MRRFTLFFIAIIACLVSATAQVESDTIHSTEITDTQIEYTETKDSNVDRAESDRYKKHFDFDFDSDTLITIVALTAVFGMPIVIVFLAFFFRYKNRKAKYKLAEQALASGQPIPESFFRGKTETGTLQKGISNVFTGIGLFIFLWAITGEFSIGCIGLLVMFTGFGQVVIHYTQEKKYKDVEDHYTQNNNRSTEE